LEISGLSADKAGKQIDYMLTLLSKKPADLSPDDQQLRQDILDGYEAILSKPFQPHAVAGLGMWLTNTALS
jgi:hypothetical protein